MRLKFVFQKKLRPLISEWSFSIAEL